MIGNQLLSQSLDLSRQLGQEYIDFSSTLKSPWTKYRELLSDE